MQGKWSNCNMAGVYLTEIIANCFRPDVDVCVFRDGEAEDIYRGRAADMPKLSGYKVIDIQYDSYQYIFFVEVK